MKLRFLLYCLLLTGFLKAQSDTAQLKEVVVSAQRKQQDAFHTAQSVTVVQANSWNAEQDRTTPEILQGVAGVFVQRTNLGGGTPILRGLMGNQTLMLVDGVRLSNATFRFGPNQYLNTVDAFSLERVECLLGSGSVQYGTDALGGVVQVFTRTPQFTEKQEIHGQLLARGASSGMEESSRVDLSVSTSGWAIQGGLTARYFGDVLGGSGLGVQRPSGYREGGTDWKALFKLGGQTQLTIAYQGVLQKSVPVYHKIVLEQFVQNEMDPQWRQLGYTRLDHEHRGRFLKHSTLLVSRQATREVRIQRKLGSTLSRLEDDRVGSTGVNWQSNFTINPHWQFSVGGEWYFETIGSSRRTTDLTDSAVLIIGRGLYPDGATHRQSGAFFLQEYRWRQWQLEGGIRYNGYRIRVSDAVLGESVLTPAALVWNMGLLRYLGETDQVHVTFSSGFRAPNIDDLGTLGIVDFRYEQPNFNLTPEYSRQVAVGWKHHGRQWSGEASVYQIQLRDLIARIRVGSDSVQGYPVYQKENIERAYIRGFEVRSGLVLGRHIKAEGMINYVFGQNVTNSEPMRRIPPMNGRFSIRYVRGNWSAFGEFLGAVSQTRLAAGDKADNRIPVGGTPGWQVINVHSSYTFRGVTLQVSGMNLGDEAYRTHGSGIAGVGRSVWVTLRYKW